MSSPNTNITNAITLDQSRQRLTPSREVANSGGAAVTSYSNIDYQSENMDFVTAPSVEEITGALLGLFQRFVTRPYRFIDIQ